MENLGPIIYTVENKNETPLITAIKQHNFDMVFLLIRSGADVNEVIFEIEATPLHIAVLEEQPKIVELLLNNDASPHSQTSDGSTPLHWIGSNDYDVVSELLVKAGAPINIQDNEGWTPLHKMVHLSNMNRVRFLLIQGADPNIQDKHGNTPLHEAIQGSGYILIELLLRYGADPLIKNKRGRTARDLAKNPLFFSDFLFFETSYLLIDYERIYYSDKNGNSSV